MALALLAHIHNSEDNPLDTGWDRAKQTGILINILKIYSNSLPGSSHGWIQGFPLEDGVGEKNSKVETQRPDSLCAALTLSFKQQIENPHNALPYH